MLPTVRKAPVGCELERFHPFQATGRKKKKMERKKWVGSKKLERIEKIGWKAYFGLWQKESDQKKKER